MMTHSSRWNPHWHSATVCINFVFSPCLSVTQPNAKSQPDGLRETGGEGDWESLLAYLFLCACGGVQQFLQLSVHGALQLLPHHFLELSHPFFCPSFTQTWTGKMVEDVGESFTPFQHIWIFETILCSIFASFVSSNYLFKSILPLNESWRDLHVVLLKTCWFSSTALLWEGL